MHHLEYTAALFYLVPYTQNRMQNNTAALWLILPFKKDDDVQLCISGELDLIILRGFCNDADPINSHYGAKKIKKTFQYNVVYDRTTAN